MLIYTFIHRGTKRNGVYFGKYVGQRTNARVEVGGQEHGITVSINVYLGEYMGKETLGVSSPDGVFGRQVAGEDQKGKIRDPVG